MGATGVWAGAVLLLLTAHRPWAVLIAFAGLGAGAAGYQMSQQTMVLEFGDRADVGMRLALSTTIEGAISASGPLLGGLVATTLGYPVLLTAACTFLSASFLVLLFKVREPRRVAMGEVVEAI